MNDKIDILMAVYNGEKYLIEQLDSILNQTYQEFNLIISDDCSTDCSMKILSEYQKKDGRIVIIKQEKNLGYVKNFEFLLTKVTNEFFMLSDQDDVWNSDKVEISLKKIKEEELMLVHTDLEVVDKDLKNINNSMIRLINMHTKATKYNDYRSVFLDNCITGCTIIANSEVINKCLPIPEKPMVHDWWVGLIASSIGKIGFIDKPTIKYRQHGNNLIGINSKKQYKTMKEYREYRLDLYYNQFKIYNDNIDKFETIYDRIKTGYEYFSYLKNREKINVLKELSLFKVYKEEKLMRKIKAFILFH